MRIRTRTFVKLGLVVFLWVLEIIVSPGKALAQVSPCLLPMVMDGVLDLSCWKGGEAIKLNGQWRFRWMKIDRENVGLSGWGLAPVPGTWENALGPDGNKVSGRGLAEYRLKVRLNKDMPSLFLSVGRTYSSLRILTTTARGEETVLYQSAPVEAMTGDRSGTMLPLVLPLPALEDSGEIIYQIANGPYPFGRFDTAPWIGTRHQIEGREWMMLIVSAALMGAFGLFALYNGALWMAKRGQLSQLWLALAAINTGVRLLDRGQLIAVIGPGLPFDVMWTFGWATFFGGVLIWPNFFRSRFPDSINKWFVLVGTVYGAVGLLLIALAPKWVFVDYGWMGMWGMYPFALIFLLSILAALRRHYRQDVPTVIGFLVFVVVTFYDLTRFMTNNDSNIDMQIFGFSFLCSPNPMFYRGHTPKLWKRRPN